MPAEEIKAIARRYIELFNQGDFERLNEVVAADLVDHYPSPGQVPGREGLKQILAGFRSSFPDVQVTIEDIVAEGDTVVLRCVGRGTHKGEFMGMAPTGKQWTVPVIAIYRVVGGKITDRWNLADWLGMLQQLGALPAAA